MIRWGRTLLALAALWLCSAPALAQAVQYFYTRQCPDCVDPRPKFLTRMEACEDLAQSIRNRLGTSNECGPITVGVLQCTGGGDNAWDWAYNYVDRYSTAGVGFCRPVGGIYSFVLQGIVITEPPRISASGGGTVQAGGDPLTITATVTQGAPKAGVAVQVQPVSITAGTFTLLDGATDANGTVRIRYTPPATMVGGSKDSTILLNCAECSNSAAARVTVVGTPPVQSCPRDTETENPIVLTTGTKVLREADFADAGAHGLDFVRLFASAWSDAPAAGLGANWNHNHGHWLVGAGSTSARMVVFADGSTSRFTNPLALPAPTTWTCPKGVACAAPVTSPGNTPPQWTAQGSLDTMVDAPDRIVVTRTEDGSRWEFDKSTGALLAQTQRNGWRYQYTYTAGKLTQIANQFGRSVALAYNDAGQLVSTTFPDGQVVGYAYDASARLSQVTRADGARRTYLYEDARWPNAVTGIVDETGQRFTRYAYDDLGRAVLSELAGGAARRAVTYGNRSSAVTDALGFTRTQQFVPLSGNTSGFELGQSSAPGLHGESVAQRVVDANSLVTQETDFLGITTMFTWDAIKRLPLSQVKAAGQPEAQTTQVTWDPVLRLPTLVSEAGRTTASTYDTLGNVLTQTVTDTASGEARTWRWTYAANNLPATMTDPKGGAWSFGYDSLGNRTGMTDPLGRTTQWTHDGAGRVISQTDPNGLKTTFSFDVRGRLVAQSRGGETSSYTYTPAGMLASATLPSGYSVSYQYDAAQRLVAASDNLGATVTFTLDGEGNALRREVKDAGGAIALATASVINNLNQVSALQGAAGQTTQLARDANGELVAQTDPLGQTTRQTLDALRRVTSTTFADSAVLKQAWNALDQLTQVVDPKAVATTYTVNAFGEVTSETSPDIGTITFKRDASGEVVETTDAKGQLTRIQRDALGRITRIDYADGKFRSFAYDAAGAIASIQDRSGSTTFERDALGRITLKTQDVADSVLNPSRYRVAYTYSGGALASITYPSGLKVFYRRSAGRITGVDVQTPQTTTTAPKLIGFLTGLTHTALGQPKSWSWFNGDAAARTFDADGRMTANEFASYTWDAASRITGITQNLWAKKTNADGTASNFTIPLTWTTGYDNRNRLTSFVRTGEQTRFSYDANGNRTSSTETHISDTDRDGAISTSDFTTTTAVTSNLEPTSNRLLGFTQTVTTTDKGATTATSTSSVTYKVDANGSLTSDGLREFIYGADGRLEKTRLQLNGEAASVRYLANSLGQRVFKSEITVDQTLPGQTIPGIKFIQWLLNTFGWNYYEDLYLSSIGTAYVYGDGEIPSWAMVGEYDNGSASASGRTEYIWLPTEDGSAIPVGIFRNGGFFAIHTDHLGTPRLMTNLNKEAVWQWPYSAFGTTEPTGALTATTNPKAAITNVPVLLAATTPGQKMNLRKAGEYSDAESGLLDNGFRALDPWRGRYVQFDPIGLAGGWNGFGHAYQNPLSYTDPTGLRVELRCRPAVIAAGLVNHCWMKTDTTEAGMNEQASCSRAGNDASGFPFVPVVVSDHSCDKPTIITPLPDVNESCVNKELKLGRALGRFAPPFNSCQTFTQDVIQKCSPSNVNTPYIGYPRVGPRRK